MEQEIRRLFERFNEAPRELGEPGLPGSLTIRPAGMQDVDALGRISANREGGDALTHSAAFMRAIEDDGTGRTSLTLVAEMEDDIIGFGKVRHLSGAHADDGSASPEGWYLTGVVVDPRFRRRGVGSRLTEVRLQWISGRSHLAYCFSNAGNSVSIMLHRRFGFVEVARGSEFAGVSFVGGEGVLFRADLTELARRGSEREESPSCRAADKGGQGMGS
jgi:ribosomal protein S18 acetylase RimI-like enzyme